MQRSFAEIAEASSLKRIVGFGSEACFLCFKDSVPTLFALALLDGVGMVGELDSMPDGSLSLGHLGLFHVSLLSLGALIPFIFRRVSSHLLLHYSCHAFRVARQFCSQFCCDTCCCPLPVFFRSRGAHAPPCVATTHSGRNSA